jgi:hypothetical protein
LPIAHRPLELGGSPIPRESAVARLDVDIEAASKASRRERAFEALGEGLA